MGPYAGVDYYNLTLCPLQSRLQHIYHGQPYARVDLNPMPESTLSPSQGFWIWPLVSSWVFHYFLFVLCKISCCASPTVGAITVIETSRRPELKFTADRTGLYSVLNWTLETCLGSEWNWLSWSDLKHTMVLIFAVDTNQYCLTI
jgi:hypothetical protein